MIGMTLCSGIGAPEVAAPWVDWRLASEIEAFPRAVLQARHGYKLPDDHNQGEPLLWGDMTEVSPDLMRRHGIPLPDVIVAGTPCQAFSIAGLRKGVDDDRGNLTLKFVEICHAIVAARPDGKLAVLWENVPGVLSDSGNAFGCFLGGLVGAVDALIPGEKPADGKSDDFWKWHSGGTYDVKDDDGEPTGETITVEPGHRISWPSEGMVQGPRSRAAWCVLDAQHFGVAQRRRRVFVVVDFGNCVDPAAVLLESESLRGNPPTRRKAGQVAPTIPSRSTGGGGLGSDFDCDGGLIPEIVPQAMSSKWSKGTSGPAGDEVANLIPVTHALRGEGFDASEDGTGRGTPLVPIAFGSKDHGADAMTDLSPTLRAGGHAGSHANAEVPPAVAFAQNQRDEVRTVEVAGAQSAQPGMKQQTYLAEAYDMRGREGGAQFEGPHDTANIRAASGGSSRSYVAEPWAVRRLTPRECHRLQGFPDDWCDVTYRGKPAADGPQYKALGNSMAVPVIAWIMNRIKISMGEK